MGTNKPLNKSDIIEAIANGAGINKKEAAGAYDAMVDIVYKNTKNDLTLPGLGKFSVAHREERQGRNPQTGASITIKAKDVVKFKVAKACQDAVTG